MSRLRLAVVVLLLVGAAVAAPHAQATIRYRFTFPEPQHRWMQVDINYTALGAAPLELRMSRSSPGRYALHDFAKNVYDVEATAAGGRELPVTRADPHGWEVAGHGGAATIRYKIFGDTLDGTYLAIDSTHAHINMPAAVMWARGLDDRPVSLRFDPPAGGNEAWRIATQLHPGPTPLEFTAPNLQYLMDSPVEFGPIVLREFAVDRQPIRIAVHHGGSLDEVDSFVRDVEKIVREQRDIFGEFPRYEPGHFTFLADYLPYASDDGMEHRNSTVLTSTTTLRTNRGGLLAAAAHEFFHGWNVERIRPRSLEPFDFERANLSGELWLAEGFTQYYGSLTMARAGLLDFTAFLEEMNGLVARVAVNPARLVRSAEEMSHMATFTDGGDARDRTNWRQTVISYYGFGGAIALALDLTLRERTGGRASLDDYMKAMWRLHGAPGGQREGYVDRPYSIADAEARLAEVSGDPAFARDFFARFIQGRALADYATLLQGAGIRLRKSAPGRAWLGDVRFDDRSGTVRLASAPPFGSPIYAAGIDVDDEMRQLDGTRIRSFADVTAVVGRRRPGDKVPMVFADRGGRQRTAMIILAEDPAFELVPIEREGAALTAAQRTFREQWVD
jgi:predicted metalloprotease with PDZ domain